MSRFVSPIWGEESNQFKEHTSLNSCSDYLPKPKRKFTNFVCQCPRCGKVYVGAIVPPTGSPFWKSLKLIKGEQKVIHAHEIEVFGAPCDCGTRHEYCGECSWVEPCEPEGEQK